MATTYYTDIQKLYVAYFGRPADVKGLAYWETVVEAAKGSTSSVSAEFARSGEYVAAFKGMDATAIVKQIYANLFNRAPEPEGLNFWATDLSKGLITIDNVVKAISEGARLSDKVAFDNKVKAAEAFTAQLDTPAEADAYEKPGASAPAKAFISSINSNASLEAAVVPATLAKTVESVITAATVGATTFLTTGADALVGTAGNDTFTARILDNANTLQSGDTIDGGAGSLDRLDAIIGTSQNFAIDGYTTNVETVSIRSQSIRPEATDNNLVNAEVALDAQSMVGVNQWESSNSRADLIIEDVRILPAQITKDITIAMVETDAGHVDFGVYFDQYSLRASRSEVNILRLQVLDTRSAAAGKDPLLENPYHGFAFYYRGVLTEVISDGIGNATKYADMVIEINKQLVKQGLTNLTATIGKPFTKIDTEGKAVTGFEIDLTSNTVGDSIDSKGTGAGWIADGAVPPSSGLHTDMSSLIDPSTDLVTAKIIVDDVGRGSTGGDLVVGGMSVGDTSTSQGVQRFEIEVRDNSKLQTINSTNNTLREVIIKNGVTTSTSHAYVTTTKDAGDLTVLGVVSTANAQVGGNGQNPLSGTFINNPLPGVVQRDRLTNAIINDQHNQFGFNDVRIIDAGQMTGKFTFDAQITGFSIAKYMNLTDRAAAAAAADNIAFVYTGGVNNDSMNIVLDGGFVGSRSTIIPGREDFSFAANGGAGDDAITVSIVNGQQGGVSAWYTNQKLNANVTVNGGDGNDTIKTPGAGDARIDGGAGVDTIYTDNTGDQGVSAIANAASSAAATAYRIAEAAELAKSITTATLADATDAVVATTAAANLNVLNLVTPVVFDAATAPTKAQIATATANAVTNLSITAAQKIAIDTAYNASTGGTVVAPTTVNGQPTITGQVAVATALTAAEMAAGDAVLAAIIATAKVAAATATAADASIITDALLLNGTQAAVQAGTIAVNGVTGTATVLANQTALAASFTVGATEASVLAAINGAITNKSITVPQGDALFAAAGGAGTATLDAAEVNAVQLLTAVMLNNATNANVAATAALAAAVSGNTSAVNAAANFVAADPVLAIDAVVANDAVGRTEAAAAASAAAAAVTAYNNATLNPATTKVADLAALKSVIAVNATELAVKLAVDNAQAKGTVTALQAADILTAANAAAPTVGGLIVAAEKTAVDLLLTSYQLTAETVLANATNVAANLSTIAAATATASAAASAAAALGGSGGLNLPAQFGTYVLNTANQAASYVLATNDERNLADLKSDVNNSHNFYNTRVVVTFLGIEAVANVDSSGFRTTDLQINQAVKLAINSDPILSKLLLATDGPANSLVVTSLIDGRLATTDFSVALVLPTAGTLTDVAGAGAAYGFSGTATDADIFALLTAAKTAFDTRGDYVDQLAETGAAGGNAAITGANSLSSSDNIIVGGAGNDVIVLGTTVGIDTLTGSNERVVYNAPFNNDVIVHFTAAGTGIDVLDFTGLRGSGGATFGSLSVDRSIVVAAESTANDSAAEIAALFADSATAAGHVYIAYNSGNVGNVYQITDAAGVAAGGVTAVLVGTIDLANTGWGTLTAANFA